MVDLTINTDIATSLDDILRTLRHASETYLSGVLCVTDDEVVSCDLLGHNSSAIIDSKASVELNSKVCLLNIWQIATTTELTTVQVLQDHRLVRQRVGLFV